MEASIHLRVSYTGTAGFGVNWPALCAREKGFYRDESLDVELVPAGQGEQTDGLLTAKMPIERRGPDEDVVRIEDGSPIRIVAGLCRRPPVTLFSQPEITSIEQLRGKTIAGVSSRYGSTLALRMLMTDFGLKDGEYEIKPYGGTLARIAALRNDECAATLLSPPTTMPATQEGFRPLARLVERYPNFLYSSMQTNTKWAADNGPTIVKLIRADIRGQQWIYDPANRDEAIALIMQADGLTREEGVECYREMVEAGCFCHAGEMGPTLLNDLIDGLFRLGEISQDHKAEACMDLRYVKEARAQLGITAPMI